MILRAEIGRPMWIRAAKLPTISVYCIRQFFPANTKVIWEYLSVYYNDFLINIICNKDVLIFGLLLSQSVESQDQDRRYKNFPTKRMEGNCVTIFLFHLHIHLIGSNNGSRLKFVANRHRIESVSIQKIWKTKSSSWNNDPSKRCWS